MMDSAEDIKDMDAIFHSLQHGEPWRMYTLGWYIKGHLVYVKFLKEGVRYGVTISVSDVPQYAFWSRNTDTIRRFLKHTSITKEGGVHIDDKAIQDPYVFGVSDSGLSEVP